METKEICSTCGVVNELSSDTVKREIFRDKKKNLYTVTYYTCKCGANNVVQIDDKDTLKLYNELKKLIIRTYRKQKKEEAIPKKWKAKKDKIMLRMRSKRKYLLDSMRGIPVYRDKDNFTIIV